MVVVSVINRSQLEDTTRLDAEYYQPVYLNLEHKILTTKSYTLWGHIKGQFVTGPFGSEFTVENYVTDTPYRYVRGKDVKEFFLLDTNNVYIPKKDFERLNKYKLMEGDILVSVVGTLGNTVVIDKSVPPAIFSCKSTAFRTRAINPFYLITYLNCRFGRTLLQRKVRGAVQTGLNIDDLRSLPIFLPDRVTQNEIAKIVLDARENYDISKSLYSQAEDLLLEELGLKDFKPKYELSYTANLSKAFGAHRVDAEYFQPAYGQVANRVLDYENGYTSLLDCVEAVRADFDPGKHPDASFRYVELADIGASTGIICSASEIKSEEAPSRARRALRQGDVVVSSVEGSLEKVALVDREYEGALASTGFFQFRTRTIYPEVFLVLSKSIVLQAQLKRECAGTILTAVPNESLKRILVPILPVEIQEKITSLVQESHRARRKEKELMEEAKRNVEQEIERASLN